MMKRNIHNPRFVKSIVHLKDKPEPPLPEFAFAGRSNVGKSSLINCLVNRNKFAKVSKSPGKTETINYFNIDECLYLVDLPGYGFARRSKETKRSWQRMIEEYLTRSSNLKTVFVLLDSKVGVKDSDTQLVEWLAYQKIPFRLIATKSDKISKYRQKQREAEMRDLLKIKNEIPIHFFSAKNKQGREELVDLLFNLALGN